MSIGLGLVFLAGLVSFFTPCVLSLIPVYIGLLGGTAERDSAQDHLRRRLFLRTLAFIGGFTLVFILLGMSGTVIGGWLYPIKDWIARVGGLVIIVFGLHVTGWINISFLNQEKLINVGNAGTNSYLGAFLMGIAFSAGWSPCIGPILGTVLTGILISGSNLARGALDLAIYSTGMALPFLLLSLGLGRGIEAMRANHRLVHAFQVTSGIMMVVMGILLLFGITSRLNLLSSRIIL
jgi:cytochrome c-type biogenesis protein